MSLPRVERLLAVVAHPDDESFGLGAVLDRFVRGGTLDDPRGVTPDVHIYTRSKVGWVTLPEGAPAFDDYYDSKQLWPAESLERLRAALA